MHSLLEILRQSDNISLLKHTGFNTKRNEAIMNKKYTAKELRDYAEAYAHCIKVGFSSDNAHYLAEAHMQIQAEKAAN